MKGVHGVLRLCVMVYVARYSAMAATFAARRTMRLRPLRQHGYYRDDERRAAIAIMLCFMDIPWLGQQENYDPNATSAGRAPVPDRSAAHLA